MVNIEMTSNNESLTDPATISGDPDIQIKLDVIEDLLSDIRDNLKDQERKRLYKDNPIKDHIEDVNEKKLNNIIRKPDNIATKAGNNVFNSTSKAISLISWNEDQVTALFLGDPSILIKAFFNKKDEIIATV